MIPQIMVEAFARSLIDKIMLEAFDMVDTEEEKLQMLNDRQESADIRPQSTRTALQMQNAASTDHQEPETMEIIQKMVHGLRNLQFGDSKSVPYHLSKLENQIKSVVYNINNVSATDATRIPEVHVTQGQGDVHQIIHDAIIETTTPTCVNSEKENESPSEATRVSVTLLHRMIEELETKTEELRNEKDGHKSVVVSKDKISVWEETEEKFIRTIESVDEPESIAGGSKPDDTAANGSSDFPNEGAGSSAAVHSTPFAKAPSSEELTIEDITPLPLCDQKDDVPLDDTSNKVKMKSCDVEHSSEQKKKGVLSRTRKLFRTMFGRRKK